MRKFWDRVAYRVDALGLRQRALIFAALAATLIVVTFFVFLNPQLAKQKQLQSKMEMDRKILAALQGAVRDKAASLALDPDAEEKARIEEMKKQSSAIRASIVEMQKDLVPAQMMARVLEDMLRRNAKLQLRSLKSIPPVMVNEQIQVLPKAPGKAESATKEDGRSASAKQKAEKPALKAPAPAAPVAAIYRHGVEIQVEGSYLEFLDYLAALEALPWRVYWGRAKLNVQNYPSSTLTLTIYTLSMDSKWMGI